MSEERECPEAMLFNPKEKMCDVPDRKEQKQSKTKGNIKGESSSG